jgi:hypothetical protein
MAASSDGNGIEAAYGGVRLRAHGGLVVLLILVAIQVAATLWGTTELRSLLIKAQASQTREHASLAHSNQVLACVLAIPPDERDQLRKQPSTNWAMWCPGIMGTGGERYP